MNRFFFIFITFILLFFTACNQKYLRVSSLQPSKVNKKIQTMKIEHFYNDSIHQKEFLEEKISNKFVDSKKLFTLKESTKVDAFLKGEVLESSMNNFIYYEESEFDRCVRYGYDEKTKKSTCIEYKVRRVPCESRTYKVSTKINLIDVKDNVSLFNKVYSKKLYTKNCYSEYDSFFPYMLLRNDTLEVNSNLAKKIANEILKDISPYYKNFDVQILDELNNNKKYSNKQIKEFEQIVKLIEDKSISQAKQKILLFDKKSVEAIYNLALIYEYENSLEKANKLYKKTKTMTKNKDYLLLINKAIIRTNQNLINKIKAKSQLP